MCGRFTLRASARTIAEQFGIFEFPPFAARFNIAPTQLVPVIRTRPAAALTPGPSPATGEGSRELVWLRWGLVPSWAKDPAIGNRLINARAETAAEKPAFRTALRRRRCLVAADGFYEWQKARKGTGPICRDGPEGAAHKLDLSPFSQRGKQPYFIRLHDDRPFAFAGLWETWEAGPLETCTLLTTDANDLIRPLHDRMPVIIAPDRYDAWLDPATENPRQLAPLLAPFPSEAMEAYPVGGSVNNPKHDSAACIAPAAGLF
jgi:putative SOS response-associated peptidase YedK